MDRLRSPFVLHGFSCSKLTSEHWFDKHENSKGKNNVIAIIPQTLSISNADDSFVIDRFEEDSKQYGWERVYSQGDQCNGEKLAKLQIIYIPAGKNQRLFISDLCQCSFNNACG